MNESSVYHLITRLCSSLIKENGENVEGFDLSSAKSVAFQELLKNNCKIPENILEELEFTAFELAFANRTEDSKQIKQLIDEIKKRPPEFEQVCWLLLRMKNIDSNDSNYQKDKNFFKIPSDFHKLSKKNAYLPSKSQQLIQLPSPAATPDTDCSFLSGILELYSGKKKTNQLTCSKLKPFEPPEQIVASPRRLKIQHTWENLDADDEASSSFCSESSMAIFLHLSAANSGNPIEVNIVSKEKLLNDLKLLIIGIESESFKRGSEDPLTFQMPKKLSCDDISDISEFVEEFLEAGSCFKRLKTFTSKNPSSHNYIFEGFIIQAFCDSIIKFLNRCRDIVYSHEVETLLEFKENTKSIRRILIYLTKFLKIHPSSKVKNILPTGSDFLGLLYREYTTILNHDIKCFFVECLKSCCQIYFNNFNKWLFQGHVEDPHGELFVQFVDHYKPNTKQFFDKAYLIRKQSIPGFLQGCADNILLCGKYTMLLKSYNEVHPLSMLPKPKLKICLTNNEMNELRAECKAFSRVASEACGNRISIAKIMQEREQKQVEKAKKAELASMRNIQRWREEQQIARIELAAKRESQLKELQDELKRIEEQKIVRRMEEIQAEKDYLDAAEEKENEELEKENADLKERIETYKKLNEQLDVEDESRQKVIEDLKSKLESKDDELNANANELEVIKTDEMNNIIPRENLQSISETALTEAQRNKIKILSHEYNFSLGETIQVKPPSPTKELSEAQRNKLKVLGSEFGMLEAQPAPEIKVQDSGNLTDLQRNRLKVMSHEFHIERKAPKTLSLLQIEAPQQHLESPMSVTSDHFSDSIHQNKSPEESSEKTQSEASNEDEETLEMLRAFEEAVEKNLSNFAGINLEEFSGYEQIKTSDSMALSRFLQQSLMVPVNAYMDILNNETLKIFVQELDILSHFKSLRNYFLMMNGEFGSGICHQLFSKLERGVRPVELINYQSLHTILDQALCQTKHDPNIENLSFVVLNIPEKFEIHSPAVLGMVTLSYRIDWPLNLILNPETMEQYKAIFNYLLKLKRISWVLDESFQILKELSKQHGRELQLSPQFRYVQQIRHKMTHFVHSLENHVTRNVLQMSWGAFVEDLKSAQSIHCIYRKHTSYLKRILFLCLLNKKSFEFQKTIEDSFRVILKFQKHLKAKDWLRTGDTFTHPAYHKIEIDGEDFERLIKYVMYLGNKIVQHGYQKEIYDLLYLIDINGYYSET